MIKVYETISKLLKFIINVLFILQIALMIIIFLTAAYWFFNLLNSDIFSFARPLADTITDFVRIFYDRDVEVGGVYVDGSLLLFDIVALVFVFLISKFKYYIYQAIDSVNINIKECNEKIEEKFNKELQKEIEKEVLKCNNVAILIQFAAKNMLVDAFWGGDPQSGVKETEDEAFTEFYSSLKTITGCRFAKTDDKMLILLDDFSKVDNLLNFIYSSVERINADMKKKKWLVFAYISIDVYDNKTVFKTQVYPVLEKLLTIHHKNEAVCLGNFNIRYKYNTLPMFTSFLKGRYNIGEEYEVLTLVKKS